MQRTAAFTRPGPDFPSLYEGRTRGKRQRYDYVDVEDEFDSEGAPARRSGRQSGHELSVAPTGPTVTASGRQVRSRATGLYGETLHSGQVDDHVSPANGDYARSSEEPQHERATMTGNRGATNGRTANRTVESDEEDATSWDGGDEDEDEPEQMELDDDEDEGADESVGEEESQSLMVTLRYRKDAAAQQAKLSSPSVAAQQLNDTFARVQIQQQQQQQLPPSTAPILPVAPPADTLPKLEGFFAPTPPYSVPDETQKTEQATAQQQPSTEKQPAAPISSAPSAPTPMSSLQ